jgi:NADH-quinone oxidoreductase subunit A
LTLTGAIVSLCPNLIRESEAKLMTGEYHPYLFLAIFLVVAAVFPLIPLGLARLWAGIFSPQKSGQEKNATYECGLESRGDVSVQFRSQYYLYAIIFLIFDVEAVFLFPFAAAFLDLSVGAFAAMMVFLLLLLEGLVWAWLKGVLTWK